MTPVTAPARPRRRGHRRGPVYDNVAFPLRQHTDLSEAEIREIVMARLSDVGLAGAEQRTSKAWAFTGGPGSASGLAARLNMAFRADPGEELSPEPISALVAPGCSSGTASTPATDSAATFRQGDIADHRQNAARR